MVGMLAESAAPTLHQRQPKIKKNEGKLQQFAKGGLALIAGRLTAKAMTGRRKIAAALCRHRSRRCRRPRRGGHDRESPEDRALPPVKGWAPARPFAAIYATVASEFFAQPASDDRISVARNRAYQ
jgi:hypothetical protein